MNVNNNRRGFITALAAGTFSLLLVSQVMAEDIKIGFVVKQPEEPWFHDGHRHPCFPKGAGIHHLSS